MAHTLGEKYLYRILSTCEPTLAQKTAAARSENFLRDLLHGSKLPIVDSYLSGSYARDTALRPIDDVDIIFLVEPGYWQRNSWFGIEKPNPKDVLEAFARAIRYRYQESPVWLQKCSVNLTLQKLQIDVVPAIAVGPDTTAICVGNQFSGEWSLSNPREHTRRSSEINRTRGELFKPLVKLLKCWNNALPSTAKVKSFLVETIAMHLFSAFSLSSLSEGLIYFWDHLAYAAGEFCLYNWRSVNVALSWSSTSVPDIGKTGNNVADNTDGEKVSRLVKYALMSRDAALAAGKARTDHGEISHWQRALRL